MLIRCAPILTYNYVYSDLQLPSTDFDLAVLIVSEIPSPEIGMPNLTLRDYKYFIYLQSA